MGSAHSGIVGNKKVYMLARSALRSAYIGPESGLPVTRNGINGHIANWINEEFRRLWRLNPGFRLEKKKGVSNILFGWHRN